VLWLKDKADSYSRGGPKSRDLFYSGWKRTVFIVASLLLFSAAAGVWVLGLVAVSQHAAELAPDGYGLSVFMMILAIFGILVLALAKPAYWAVRILINR
jgi:surface polysaccharide O-acyltransferase-like enzyme